MGFTRPEIKTPVPPIAGNEIQSFGDVKLYQLGSKFIKKEKKHRIFLI